MSFTIQNLEYDLLVLMRVSAFVMTAPMFRYNAIPNRMKAAISFWLSLIVIQTVPAVSVSYEGVFGYSALILKESAIGAVLGFMCTLCTYIVNFAGQIMDIEMGLSMAQMFDPLSNTQVTISGNIYNYMTMLMMLVTNMHYYIIRAIIDSFQHFNVGKAVFRGKMTEVMIQFMGDYFLISVRIVLPVFCCMLMINVVLGVLAKAAPQMNMFVVGMQIKIIVGIIVLLFLIQTLPTISDFIFTEMKNVITDVINGFRP